MWANCLLYIMYGSCEVSNLNQKKNQLEGKYKRELASYQTVRENIYVVIQFYKYFISELGVA